MEGKTVAVKEYVSREREYLIGMRRYFHAHPEVSLKEYNTCRKIEEELDKMAVPHERVGETGVYAWIDGKRQKMISQEKLQAGERESWP